VNVLTAAILAITSGAAASDPSARVTDAQSRVREADAARCAAMRTRDLDRFSSLLSDDVAFFADQMPVARGPAAVRELLAAFFDPRGPAMRCEPRTVEVSRSGDLAYVTGTSDVTGTEAERSPTAGHGKYVTIWRRDRAGKWKLILAIGNAEPRPQQDFGPPPTP
jgi:uncharacterized protein (TIGR02246 family)